MQEARSCLADIEALSSETSSEKRRQVLNLVTDLFLITNDQQSGSDVTAFGSVMDRIAYELEVEARVELSERLSEIDKAPRQLVRKLASDDIAVAKPVLERSNVLTDDDLVEIAKTRGQTHLHAISKRPTLSTPVTDVIVDRGNSDVLVEVTRNKGAEFSTNGIDTLAQKARTDESLLTALGSRADLPPDVMQEIKQRVASRLTNEMGANATASEIANVEALVDRSADNLDIDEFKKSSAELQEKANARKLTEEDLVALARAGELSKTVHAIAILTGLDDRMVSHCFLKADIAALAILCKANEFSSQTYLAFLQTRTGKNGVDARAIARAMREYETLSPANATRTLRFLKVKASASGAEAAQPQPANNVAIPR